ncbi:MAG: spore coat protein [Bacteroidota bacterium]
MIIAFVPCRLQSKRLPNKAIQDIYGISAIERCLINTLAIPGIDKVVLATSTNKVDEKLEKYNLNGQVEIVRGPEDDVLERFMPTINQLKPDHIVRVTGDCPLVSFELGQETIKRHIESGCDVTFTISKVALGTACEIYKTKAILKLKKLIKITNHSEYLIYYFSNNPEHFSLNKFEAPEQYIRPWRLTLDETNDLELLNLIYKTLNIGKRPVSFYEVITFFERFPETAQINIGNVVKYRDNKELVEYLKRATSI